MEGFHEALLTLSQQNPPPKLCATDKHVFTGEHLELAGQFSMVATSYGAVDEWHSELWEEMGWEWHSELWGGMAGWQRVPFPRILATPRFCVTNGRGTCGVTMVPRSFGKRQSVGCGHPGGDDVFHHVGKILDMFVVIGAVAGSTTG